MPARAQGLERRFAAGRRFPFAALACRVHGVGLLRTCLLLPGLVLTGLVLPGLLLTSCGGSYRGQNPGDGGGADPAAIPAQRPGTLPAGLEFLYSFENEVGAEYFPIEGIAGCEYGQDGSLIFCDEKRGKVYGLDPRRQTWFEFDTPLSRPYNPVDVRSDGFKVLVLDMGGNQIFRFDQSGAQLDLLLDIRQLDPGYPIQASAFDVDQDGRMVITDAASQQILLLDSFLNLTMRLGGPGGLGDQFQDPSGIVFLADGGFLVSDRGNRRLALYGRLGFFEETIGGEFDLRSAFVAPQGIDRDRFGNVFVADLGNGLIHVLDQGLRLRFSAGGGFSLQGTPMAPIDVALGPDDLLAVTDRARSAILVYRILYE